MGKARAGAQSDLRARGTVRDAASDPRILALALAGGEDARERLLEAVRPIIVQTVARRWLRAARHACGPVGDDVAHDVAEDVAQDTLLRVYVRLSECRAVTPRQFVAWTLAVARHVFYDRCREPLGLLSAARISVATIRNAGSAHSERAPHGGDQTAATVAALERALADQTQDSASDDAPGDNCAEAYPDPDATIGAMREEDRRRLAAALDAFAALHAAAAEVVWLRLGVGASWREIAAATGISGDAAKRRYQRAQAALRRAVARQLDAPVVRAARRVTAARRPRGVECQTAAHPEKVGT